MEWIELIKVALAGVGLMVPGLIWLIRLEGRQNVHEAVCAERYAAIMDKLDTMTHRSHGAGV